MKLLDRASAIWRRTREALAGGASGASADSSAWPETEASIYSSEAKSRGREQFGVEVWYEFHAEGDHWSGSDWIQCDDYASAESVAGAHPAGNKIRILYCPGNPSQSILVDSGEKDDDGL